MNISNVPGPRERGRVGAALVTEIYSVGPLTAGSGLNITVWSYVDQLSGLHRNTPRRCTKPLIAAVEGYALAGGTELALAADLIVAARDSAFGIPEVKRGLVAGGGGLLRLPERIPYAIAMELALTGDNLPAERAHELGLVNVLAEPGTALDAAIALAEKITANGPLAVVATKRIITESRGWSPDTMFAEQMKILVPVFTSNDAKEGAIAFAERRRPRWTGT